MYVFDYGAPVSWRLAVKHPQKVTAIVSQNGNAYEVGLSEGWADLRKAWNDPTAENREALRRYNTPEMIKWQYTDPLCCPLHGAASSSPQSPGPERRTCPLTRWPHIRRRLRLS